MLSYLHAFHAGNRADVVKHAALDAVFRALRLQPRPLHYLDTHSGRGLYDLSSAEARKTSEADDGILAILAKKRRPAAITPYLDLVKKFNPPSRIRVYPGSPAIAAARLRPLDRITLCEKHPREQAALKENFAGDERIDIKTEDGWSVLRTGLKARSDRRLIALVDPSYETPADYQDAIALAHEIRRAPRQSILIIWFPILSDGRQQSLWDAAFAAGGHLVSVNWPAPETGRVGLLG
ncbi:MAG: 23S rRNA (adenine(2030)-N(6))-methyltransferase RlmJ, partial [Caulobacterales bacterium]